MWAPTDVSSDVILLLVWIILADAELVDLDDVHIGIGLCGTVSKRRTHGQ